VDTTPNAFSFTAQTGVGLSTAVTSNTITVSGINAAAPISVSGGTYNVNGGGYTGVAGTVTNGNTVSVRLTSAASNSTQTCATLTIGGVNGTFCATTLAAVVDTTPNAFGFTAQTGVGLSTTVTSNTITVSGINAAAPISVSGGTYNVNGGGYTGVAGTVNNGNTVSVRLTSAASNSTPTCATLTIGGVNGTFCATTLTSSVDTRDFNNDGKADILWRHTSGTVAMWLMNGASITSNLGVATIPTDWTIVGVGDFNNDGKADILWRHTSGTVAMWLMNGASITSNLGVATIPTSWTTQ
jgi:hypothetical protein